MPFDWLAPPVVPRAPQASLLWPCNHGNACASDHSEGSFEKYNDRKKPLFGPDSVGNISKKYGIDDETRCLIAMKLGKLQHFEY